MRVLNFSAVALCGGLLSLAGCSAPPDHVIVDPPEQPAAVHSSRIRIEAGPDSPKRAQAALDRREGW